jgi:hypothetical protein
MRKGTCDDDVINIDENKSGLLRSAANEQGGVGAGADESKFEEAITKARKSCTRGLF